MLPIPTAPVTAASEAAPRGQTLLRRAQASPWVSFLESGRVVLGVMVGVEHQLGVLEGPCWLEASSAVVLRRVPTVMTKPLFSSAKNLAQQSD
jgi:hypothetical protein